VCVYLTIRLRPHQEHASWLVQESWLGSDPGDGPPRVRARPSRLRRMQYRPGLIDGFLAKTRLDLSNFHD
jgi:hypothetical protein